MEIDKRFIAMGKEVLERCGKEEVWNWLDAQREFGDFSMSFQRDAYFAIVGERKWG